MGGAKSQVLKCARKKELEDWELERTEASGSFLKTIQIWVKMVTELMAVDSVLLGWLRPVLLIGSNLHERLIGKILCSRMFRKY